MPARIVQQPDGRFARFSTICDDFTDVNMSRDEAWELLRKELGSELATTKVAAAILHPARFAEALDTILTIHGQVAVDLVNSLLAR